MPLSARVANVVGIVFGAACIPLVLLVRQPSRHPALLLGLCVVIGGIHRLTRPNAKSPQFVRFECTGTAMLAALFLFGPAACAIPVVVANPLIDRFERHVLPWYVRLTNALWAPPAALAGWAIMRWLHGNALAPLPAGAVCLFVNVIYIGVTFGLERRQGLAEVAQEFAPYVWHNVQDVLLATCFMLAWQRSHVLALVVPLLVIGQVKIGRQATQQVEAIRIAEREAELNAMRARVDGLTGLANRRALDERMNAGTPPTSAGFTGAVLLADLDHFKTINDLYGHAAGDAALQATADALRKVLRPGDLCARYGGEEFCIVLDPCPEGLPQAASVAERIRQEVQTIELADHPDLALTVSIGVALWSDTTDLRTALAEADDAVYEAKRHGRNRVWPRPGESRRTLGLAG